MKQYTQDKIAELLQISPEEVTAYAHGARVRNLRRDGGVVWYTERQFMKIRHHYQVRQHEHKRYDIEIKQLKRELDDEQQTSKSRGEWMYVFALAAVVEFAVIVVCFLIGGAA